MKTLITIPARMASKRFPNKPMALINGKPMIQRVWEIAKESKIGDVIVACCEVEDFKLIVSLGGKAEMTDPNLPTGTDRETSSPFSFCKVSVKGSKSIVPARANAITVSGEVTKAKVAGSPSFRFGKFLL